MLEKWSYFGSEAELKLWLASEPRKTLYFKGFKHKYAHIYDFNENAIFREKQAITFEQRQVNRRNIENIGVLRSSKITINMINYNRYRSYIGRKTITFLTLNSYIFIIKFHIS